MVRCMRVCNGTRDLRKEKTMPKMTDAMRLAHLIDTLPRPTPRPPRRMSIAERMGKVLTNMAMFLFGTWLS